MLTYLAPLRANVSDPSIWPIKSATCSVTIRRALHQRHEYVVVVDAVELATVALELDALDTAEVRRRHGRFAESATKTGPSKGEKNAHAEAPDAAEAFELSPHTNAALCSIGGPTTKAM